MLSCNTQIVCVYEATCSVVERLVVSVDVEKDWGQDTSMWQVALLFSPSATLIVQFHIEPATGQQVLDYSTLWAVLSYVVEFLYKDSIVHCVVSSR